MNIAKVIIIDDDRFVRTSLTAGLRGYGVEVVGSATSYSEAIDVMSKTKVEVAIVDLDLGPGPSGIDICYSLRDFYPQLGLILLTSYSNPKIADPHSRPLPKGCRFLSKSTLSDFETLVNDIVSARANPHSTFRMKPSKNVLTDTQLEVLKLVASGLSSSEIAERRNVSIKSIDGIISKIHKALNLEKSKSLNQRVLLARAYFQLSGKRPPGA
jgi:DNA-binding NarL/FixJ family response regulator